MVILYYLLCKFLSHRRLMFDLVGRTREALMKIATEKVSINEVWAERFGIGIEYLKRQYAESDKLLHNHQLIKVTCVAQLLRIDLIRFQTDISHVISICLSTYASNVSNNYLLLSSDSYRFCHQERCAAKNDRAWSSSSEINLHQQQ